MDRRLAIGIALALVIGFAAGYMADRSRLFGYRSFDDCILRETVKQDNPRFVVDQLVGFCGDYEP